MSLERSQVLSEGAQSLSSKQNLNQVTWPLKKVIQPMSGILDGIANGHWTEHTSLCGQIKKGELICKALQMPR